MNNLFLVVLFCTTFCMTTNKDGNKSLKDELKFNELKLLVAKNDKISLNKEFDSGVNVNIRNDKKETLLHYAAEIGNVEMMLFLITRGVDINARDNDNKTALYRASKHKDAWSLLIKKGAEVDATDKY